MSLSIGIVGLPNVGKSTLFNALTKNQAPASNYPFCTIDPNTGVVKVPDQRLIELGVMFTPQKITPTTIEFVDIAGLVKGAHEGEGLGNKFLSHIRECDAICEVVRSFLDSNITHVSGQINPDEDQETINLELILADLQTVEKRLDKTTKDAKGGGKEIVKQKLFLEKLKAELGNGNPIRQLGLDQEEKELIRDLHLITRKPIIYILNTNDRSNKTPCGKWDGEVIELNAKEEEEISALPEEEQPEFIKALGLTDSGLNKLIKASYRLLNLITFLTVGPDEVRAWTVQDGIRAPQAAGVIHTDFEQGFIRVEVINWRDLIKAGGESVARAQGLIRTEGKDYVIKDGDVCHFLFSK